MQAVQETYKLYFTDKVHVCERRWCHPLVHHPHSPSPARLWKLICEHKKGEVTNNKTNIQSLKVCHNNNINNDDSDNDDSENGNDSKSDGS